MTILMKVDTAITVPVNVVPLIDDSDFKSIEDAIAYDAAGMDLRWNFWTKLGVGTSTPVTPTTGGGNHDWTHMGDGMYKIGIPASGGDWANDAEGFGYFSGVITGVLPFRGPTIQLAPANLVDSLVDGSDLLQVDLQQWRGSQPAILDGTLVQTDANVSVTINPISVTVSSGEVSDVDITAYQHGVFGPFTFTIVDSDGNAVDLTDCGLSFCVYERDTPETILWQLDRVGTGSGNDTGDIDVAGVGGNQVTVSDDDTNTGTPGIYRYVLWDTTNDMVRARGRLFIEKEADSS